MSQPWGQVEVGEPLFNEFYFSTNCEKCGSSFDGPSRSEVEEMRRSYLEIVSNPTKFKATLDEIRSKNNLPANYKIDSEDFAPFKNGNCPKCHHRHHFNCLTQKWVVRK